MKNENVENIIYKSIYAKSAKALRISYGCPYIL